MPDYLLRLLKESMPPQTRAPRLEAVDRVIYVLAGGVEIRDGAPSTCLDANEAWGGSHSVELRAMEQGCVLFRWELLTGEVVAHGPRPAGGIATEELLMTQIELPSAQCLMRCDRVDFPPGGVAYLHTHKGPGIRCLLHGRMDVRVTGQTKSVKPLTAWFETGKDPVFAAASQTEPTAFVRVMILPLDFLGKSSISYVNDEDREKPKPQQYSVFVDRPIGPL